MLDLELDVIGEILRLLDSLGDYNSAKRVVLYCGMRLDDRVRLHAEDGGENYSQSVFSAVLVPTVQSNRYNQPEAGESF